MCLAGLPKLFYKISVFQPPYLYNKIIIMAEPPGSLERSTLSNFRRLPFKHLQNKFGLVKVKVKAWLSVWSLWDLAFFLTQWHIIFLSWQNVYEINTKLTEFRGKLAINIEKFFDWEMTIMSRVREYNKLGKLQKSHQAEKSCPRHSIIN